MRFHFHSSRCLMAAFASVLALPVLAQQGPASFGASGPTSVGVVTLETQAVPVTTVLPGRAVAFQQVDIRPRVTGVITEIAYDAGRRVEKGDVLFRIGASTFVADLAAADASVALAEATVETNSQTVTRYEGLEGVGVTGEELASARLSLKQAEADLSAARAARDLAALDVENTEIRAPFAGFADVPTVSEGALVTASQSDALTTITQLDPVYIDVAESSRQIAAYRARIDAGTLTPGQSLEIGLQLETGETYAGKGTVVAGGTQVSTTTGTAEFRFRFDNPDRQIMPGQFLRVSVTLGTTDAVLVPQGATSRSAAGDLTAFVAQDGKADSRILTSQGSYNNAWVVTDGVVAGELLIVDGLSNLRDGAEVQTVPVTIAPNGVVTETAAAQDN